MSSTKEKSKSCMMYDRIYWERTAKAKKTKQWFIKRCSTMLRWKAYSIIITFHFYEWCTIWGGISTQNSTFQFLHSWYEALCEKICRHISFLGKKEVWCIYQSKQVSPCCLTLYDYRKEVGWIHTNLVTLTSSPHEAVVKAVATAIGGGDHGRYSGHCSRTLSAAL